MELSIFTRDAESDEAGNGCCLPSAREKLFSLRCVLTADRLSLDSKEGITLQLAECYDLNETVQTPLLVW